MLTNKTRNCIRNTSLVLFCLALSGCAKVTNTETPFGIDEYNLGDFHHIYVVTLKDGTRCATYKGPMGRGGIDCDWK